MVISWRGVITPRQRFGHNSQGQFHHRGKDVDGLIDGQGGECYSGFGDDDFTVFGYALAVKGRLGHTALAQPKITVTTE